MRAKNLHILSPLMLSILLAGMVAASASAAPEKTFKPDAPNCAMLYKAVAAERQFGFDDGDFWRFSNARAIDFAARAKALRDRSDNPLGFDILTTPLGKTPPFPAPSSREAGFQGLNPMRPDTPPSQSATPAYGRWLAACDAAHGFSPAFSFGVPSAAVASQGERIADRLCMGHYWTLGVVFPAQQPVTTPRIRHAFDAHRRTNPGIGEQAMEAEVWPLVEARAQRITSRQEPLEVLFADVRACDVQYGLAPPEG